MIELKGALPTPIATERVLVQDAGNALRPLGCPLSAKLDTLSFIPWFMTKNLTGFESCELLPHGLNVTLAPDEASTLSLVYFARVDAEDIQSIPQAAARVIR